jgi:lipoprotein-releasing system permease protein
MGYPLVLALRYLGSKKRAFVSIGTVFATLGVMLGVAALSIVMSVTGGFQEQFREKVLGVNAHVLVLKYSVDFREYRDIIKKVERVPGVIGTAPFVINPMMVTHGDRTATGVLLKGVDPEGMQKVLDLPRNITAGSLEGLRRPGARPPQKQIDAPMTGSLLDETNADADGGPAAEVEGGRATLLQAIERQIAEDDRRQREAAEAGAGATPVQPEPTRPEPLQLAPTQPAPTQPEPRVRRDDDGDLLAPPPGAPTGSVTPKGGFASVLPDDDALPAGFDPDPCSSPAAARELPGAVIGKSLAQQLGVGLGDCLQITSPTVGVAFGSTRAPIAKQFRVIAVFEAGFDQYDSKLVYADLYEAQAFYEYGDSVTGVEMKVSDIDDSRRIANEIEGILNNGIYHTMDWMELNHGLFTALLIQKIGMSVVLALMIVVAAFTVIATLIMMVLEKKKEIAILKAIGAPDAALLRVFLYQGVLIGGLGTVSGLVLGFLGCKALVKWAFPLDPKVYFISRLPVQIRPAEFLIAGAFAVVTCAVATLFPALYAARLRPSEGLRAE